MSSYQIIIIVILGVQALVNIFFKIKNELGTSEIKIPATSLDKKEDTGISS